MKKVDLLIDTKSVYVIPPELIEENDPDSIKNYMLPKNKERVVDYNKARRFGEETFKMKIGGTTYEVSTHFNPKGRQCIFEQFKELILSEKLL